MENEKLIEMLLKMDARMQVGFEKIDARFDAIDERFDKIENRLEKIHNTLLIMNMPVVEPTEEELEAIRIGKEQFANGEYTSYNSIEELKKDIMNDD